MKGWVYVISNRAMPGLIKIGYSMQDPTLRAEELNHTGNPHPYTVDYEVLVENPYSVEQRTHAQLNSIREGKEWFRCTSEQAVAAIQATAGDGIQLENFKRADRLKAETLRKEWEQDEWAERAASELRHQREAELDAKAEEIISRYEPALKAALPQTGYWAYFAGVFIGLAILMVSVSPNLKDSALILLSTIGAFVITPFIQGRWENHAKQSAEYKSILSRREAELASVEEARAKLR